MNSPAYTDGQLLSLVRAGGMVKRYHTQPHLGGRQDVAQHSFGVAMLMLTYCPWATSQMLSAALTHDMGEQFVADIPSPFKWANPEVAKAVDEMEETEAQRCGWRCETLSEAEELWLHTCDKLEGILFCTDELIQGNFGAIVPAERYVEAVQDMDVRDANLARLVQNVVQRWGVARLRYVK